MKVINVQAVFVVIFALAILSLFYLLPNVSCANPSSAYFTIVNARGEYSQEAFTSIQQAIDEAENGSTIIVPSGKYYEHVLVNKTVSLVGQDVLTTIVDGTDNGTIIQVVADNVNISDFTILNSGCKWAYSGICVYRSQNCTVKNCYLSNNCHNINISYSINCRVFGNTINGKCYGIRFMNSFKCTAFDNYVSNCYGGIILANATNCAVTENNVINNGYGLRLDSPCAYNTIFENEVFNNDYYAVIAIMPGNSSFVGNILFHNNFVDNRNPPVIQAISGIAWDDGYPFGGNYWSQYNGTDIYHGQEQNETGYDGIGDSEYILDPPDIHNVDRYPLTHPYGSIRNLETNLTYLTIQSAINATETLSGHTIFVKNGIYYEHVVVNKALSLIGENLGTTIIDGGNTSTVVTVKADSVNVSGFTIRNSGQNYPPYGNDCGVLLDYCNGANISYNIITNDRIGLYLFYSQEDIIENNIVSSNHEDGIWLWYSGGNLLKGNTMLNNSYNFGVFGGSFSDFNNTIDSSNTVNGKPIMYHIGVKNEVFDNHIDVGVLYLISCNNVTVRNLNLKQNGHGVFGFNITNSRIENVTALENNYGIYVQESHDNLIEDNQCLDNWVGICLHDSINNTVEGNIVENNEKGISLYEASHSSIMGNTVLNNLYGIRFYNSHFNKVFHNSLIENTEQVSLIPPSYQNVWDNGFEGNFWSDYNGSDVVQDGIGDASYIIDNDNYDNFPLMGTFSNFCVYYNGSSYSVPVISNSTIVSFIFEDANNRIRLTINGADGTYGFCRISIPHALIMPEITVAIDNKTAEVLHPNYNLRDDGYCRWIYFAYQHSAHGILISSASPSVIFPSILVIATLCSSLLIIICCLLVIWLKRKRK
jgi:parallel beta-helix repeat protein